jgi:hypothetical protein
MYSSFSEMFSGRFGDVRLARRATFFADQFAEYRVSIVRQLGVTRAGTVGIGRFLANEAVTAEEIFQAAGERCGSLTAGRHVLAIQDTTALSFPRRRAGTDDWGPGGDGKVAGIFLHPVIVLDAADGSMLGLAAGRVWIRETEKVKHRRKREFKDRESARWVEEGENTKRRLAQATAVTLIADRESDIYREWAQLPDERFHLIIRAAQDRALSDGARLFAAASAWPVAGRRKVTVAVREQNGVKRTAHVELRFGPVSICKPKAERGKGLAASITAALIDVREIDAPADCKKPIHWRLLTSHKVETGEEGWQIVDWYRLRWRIEEYNRVLKRSGLDLESAMLEGGKAMTKLAAMGAVVGAQVTQLVEGRDAPPERLATEVLEEEELPIAEALCRKLEGKTAKQKNPHAVHSLAWLSWIVARLGGWSGYECYGPAGPKTMATGWRKFQSRMEGWKLKEEFSQALVPGG